MLRRVAPAAVLGGTLIFVLTAHLSAGTRTVDRPMFNGNRLGWCANWGADCGEPAAEAWCVAQGFAGADGFERAPRIGDKSPTRLIATGAVCDDADCDGFKTITCVKLDTVEPKSASASAAPDLPPAKPMEAAAVSAVEVENPQPVAASPAVELAPTAAADPAPLSVPEAEAAAAAIPVPRSEANAVRELEGDTPEEIRVIAPEAEASEPMTTGSTPVQTAAVAAEAGDDEDGPPPPDTWLLAAAGAPPLRPVLEIFATPTFNGRRLDWCRGWKDKCGKATADEFCRLNGFVEALSFAPDPKIGAAQPTRQIASGLVCDHDECDGFAEIACTK